VTLPGENSFDGVYDSVKMRSANEGWIVARHSKNSHGITVDSLTHLINGHWTALDSPLTAVSDVLSVAPNEAWVAGVIVANQQQTPALYHYHPGSWTSVALPSGVVVDRLRMVLPNDLWASGHINAPSNVDYEQSAAVLHFDGSSWQSVTSGASGHPQFIQAFNRNTSWAFTINTDMGADTINGTQYQHTGTWLRVKWPFTDMNMGEAPFGMSPMQRVSADEYWSIGVINPTGGDQHSVLYYFASGAWHAYGQ
jgi:hypothetical protein